MDVPLKFSVQLHLHPLVEILWVGHAHQTRATLAVEHGYELIAYLAPLLSATLHHGTLTDRLVIFVRHFLEVLQKMVEGIPFLIPLDPPLKMALHLQDVGKDESQRQMAGDVFPLAHHFLFGPESETHPHQKDAMIRVMHGWGSRDAHGRVQPLYFFLGHGHVTGHVMDVGTVFDLIHLSHRELSSLDDLLRGFGTGHETFGTGNHLVVDKVGVLFLEARPMHPLLVTIHEKQLITICHGEFMTQVTSYITINGIVPGHSETTTTLFSSTKFILSYLTSGTFVSSLVERRPTKYDHFHRNTKHFSYY